jgi:cobalt-zinc-cadmium efflux system outer membrane protein
VKPAAVLLALALGGPPLAALAQPSPPTAASPAPPPVAPRPVAFAGLPLSAAEDAAVAQSPDVAGASAVVRENAAALAAARGALGPSLTGSYTEGPQAGPNGDTISQHITNVGVQTTLGDLAAYSPLVASATATLRGAQASLAAAQRAERVKTIGLYYDALKARAIAQARDEALSTARRQRDAAAIRVKAGDAPRLDLVRANVAVARATATAETARAADQNATEALSVESGVRTPLDRTVEQALPAVTNVAPDTAVALARRNRADLRAAQQTTLAAQAAANAAKRQQLPAVTVGVGYSKGVDGGVQVRGPSLSVTVGLPLNGAARAGVAQKNAIVAEDAAKAQAQERQVALDVAAAARNLAAAQRASVATAQAREEAQRELDATTLGYRNGASSSLEVAAARDTYTQALVDELSSLYDELKARASLDLETGP